jgi:hypothetical protein
MDLFFKTLHTLSALLLCSNLCAQIPATPIIYDQQDALHYRSTNSKRTLCKCKNSSTQAFFTFSGACDSKTCATGFWSGATPEIGDVLRKALMKKSNLKTMPLICGTQSSSN